MFNLIYEFFLVISFFIAFKFFDIYVATVVAIAGSGLQVVGTRLWLKRFDKKQLMVLTILVVFGGMTLYFHDPIFIKWKPSIVFWLLGGAFLVNQLFGKKVFVEHMMNAALVDKKPLPKAVWKNLNLAWTIFFIVLGTVNIFIAYYFSTDAWVNFKVYGILGALILFGFLQSIYLASYMNREESNDVNHSN